MPHDVVIAMNVTDPQKYTLYRAAMTPILHRYAGSFVYDLVVAQVLKSPTQHPITRVFMMRFPDRATRERFFADAEYLAAKAEHFTQAVDGFTLMAEVG